MATAAPRFQVLASDYDGTLAADGFVVPDALRAVERWRASGRRFVLVTGRQLEDLFERFPRYAVCDRVVAENGAVLHDPARVETRLLGAAPEPELVAALRARGVPFAVGRVILATHEPHGAEVAEVVRALEVPRHLSLNKGAVMVLPRGVDKGSGLRAALRELGVPEAATVAVGDAENDVELLRAAGLSVAVRGAVGAVENAAHEVTRGDDGAGVIELIDRLLREPR